MTPHFLCRRGFWLALLPLLGCTPSTPDGSTLPSSAASASRALPLATGPALLCDINTLPSPFPPILTDTYSYGGGVVTLANGTTLMVLEDHLTGRELWRSDGTATGTTLTRDLTPGLLSSSQGPTSLTAAGNTAYFFSATSFGGTLGLWKTDGTTPGTIVLHEFDGVLDDHDSRQGEIAALGSSAFFSFDGGLWKTDGTVVGTRELKRFPPAELYDFERPGLEVAQALGDVMLLVANDAASGMELWKTDGTEAGTVLVKDLVPGPASSWPRWFTRSGSNVFFAAGPEQAQNELWKTDGTPEGTIRLLEFPIYMDRIDGMAAAGDTLFFSTFGALWKTDGTPRGTVEVMPFNRWRYYDLTPVGNRVFFVAHDSAGEELWTSDGTATGTSRVADLWPGAGDSQPINLFAWKGHLYFQATPRERVLALYKTDGTAASTVELKSWEGYTGDSIPGGLEPINVGDSLVFRVEPLSGGVEMWRTDGTVAGTRILEPLRPDATQSSQVGLRNVGILNDQVFFLASDDGVTSSLWKSNGTAVGTSRVRRFEGASAYFFFTEGTAGQRVGSQLFFVPDNGLHQAELWKTDGTEAGTVRVKDFATGPGEYGNVSNLVELGGALVFATGIYEPVRLWRSDGTEAGTTQLIPPGASGDFIMEETRLTKLGSQVLFFAQDEEENNALWTTDGTSAGTRRIELFTPGEEADYAYVDEVVAGEGAIYFEVNLYSGETQEQIVQLWKSDGTEAGTVPLLTQGLSSIDKLAWVNGRLYFSGEDAVHGAELWVSDGTVAGTRLLAELASGPASSYPHQFTKLGTSVFFTAHDATHGFEPFVTNGTPEGTVRLADIWPGAESGMRILDEDQTAFITPLAIEDRGLVVFTAAEPEGGAELWRTDGTAAGTYRWVDAAPGAISADPSNLARVGDRLFFFAVDEAHGREPWAVSLDHTGT